MMYSKLKYSDGRLLAQLGEGLFVHYCNIHDIAYDWEEERCPSCVYDEDFWGYGDRWEKCPDGQYHSWDYKKYHSMMNFSVCHRCNKETIEYDPGSCDAIRCWYSSSSSSSNNSSNLNLDVVMGQWQQFK